MNKHTKKALFTSILSLLLCVSMLVGTTFAWFTDSVTTGVNTIASGNLDVDVYYGDPEDEDSIQGIETLFNDVKLWEPGAVAYENLTVVNKGSLALKYEMAINFLNENSVMVDGVPTYSLPQILKVACVDGGVDETLTREELIASVSAWEPLETFVLDGELLAQTMDETVGLVIYWEPGSDDNNWNVNNGKVTDDNEDYLHVDLGISLVATQYTYESDSFGNQYDKDAIYPATAWKVDGKSVTLASDDNDIIVTVPDDAPAGEYALAYDPLKVNEATDGDLIASTDLYVTLNGKKVDDANITFDVTLKIDIMSTIEEVLHNGEKIANYNYDPFTGAITFQTNSFSPFSVEYEVFGDEVVLDGNKITGGFFKGVNPATLDASLLGDDSEYIAVDYVKDGVKYYSVSERATTVILGDKDDSNGYTFENGNYTVTMENGNLWSVISGLQGNAHSTVYLLPGTYEEATTIYVYSSMDIIGLGDTEDIKVIKKSSSGSNRHLFNCNGTKADYIEVTIRNMTLDATVKTENNKDNAAVQSIRKSKVKCYDLSIIKGTGWDAVAFYVNGNNAVDGVKYPAYLYAENCTLNTTRTFGVVSTSGSYKFYHSNVTYGGVDYTNNSGSIKNQTMEWNDWDWEN